MRTNPDSSSTARPSVTTRPNSNIPLDDSSDSADAVVLAGIENTVDDLFALRDAGFDAKLEAFDGPVLGLGGGYQLLGERITNADIESPHDMALVRDLGLLPGETQLSPTNSIETVTCELRGWPACGRIRHGFRRRNPSE